MLDICDERSVIEDAWNSAEAKTVLPPALAKRFFEPTGPMRGHFDNRRMFHRFYLRGKAILIHGDAVLAVYTKDISRQGICILSPVQLFPKQRARIRMPNGADYLLEVARCQRIDDHCFECGTKFAFD